MSLIDIIRKNRKKGAETASTDSVRKITEALERMEPDRARFLAAFAYLLGRVARADLRVGTEETRAMEHIVVEHGGIPEDQAVVVVHMAKAQNALFGSTENYLVTREFKEIATDEQKIRLLDALFAVAASDESISTIETNEIRQIVDELKVDPAEYTKLRSAYKDSLAVFKRDGL